MKSSNKNIRDHRTARTTRLKSRIEASNQLIQQLNPQEFQIPLPEFHNTQPHSHKHFPQPNPFSPSLTGLTANDLDERKQLIKQKIKFRVKQELWALMKKSSQKICISEALD